MRLLPTNKKDRAPCLGSGQRSRIASAWPMKHRGQPWASRQVRNVLSLATRFNQEWPVESPARLGWTVADGELLCAQTFSMDWIYHRN